MMKRIIFNDIDEQSCWNKSVKEIDYENDYLDIMKEAPLQDVNLMEIVNTKHHPSKSKRFTNNLVTPNMISEVTNESSIKNITKDDIANSDKEIFNDSKTIDFSWNSIHMRSLRDLKSLSDHEEKMLMPKLTNRNSRI